MRLRWRLLVALALAWPFTPVRAVTYVVGPDADFVRSVDAIVIADTLGTSVEDSPDGFVRTVVVLRLLDVLKGGLDRHGQLELRVPGGMTDERLTVVPGAPRFVAGERSLLFLRRLAGGDYAVADLALGAFTYRTDETGRVVVLRSALGETILAADGTSRREPARDAEAFVKFIRGTVRHEPVSEDYRVERRPLLPGSIERDPFLDLRPDAAFTVTQYTMASPESAAGTRWKTFPVSWNKGSTQPGVTNGGTDAITTALTMWNADSGSDITLVLAGAVANSVGADNFASDQVNNVVFEKNMVNTVGIATFSCSTGGAVGYCIITAKVVDATNVTNGEQFFTTIEADISMNQGVGACIGMNISETNFNTALAHEFGHSLSLRHSDKTRNLQSACSTVGTYDCASSALMTAALAPGVPAMQAWEKRAVAALYPAVIVAPPAPAGLVATATAATTVALSWGVVATATSYDVYRRPPSGSLTFLANAPGTSFNDFTAAPETSYRYTVRAKNSGGTSADSNADLATTVLFTNDPLAASTDVVSALHLSELRVAVNAVRAQSGVGPFAFTDGGVAGIAVKALHITELRTALDGAALTETGGYTDGSLAGVAVKAVHFHELRNRVK